MTLIYPFGPEATAARMHDLGAESDRPSWHEARADQADITAATERDCSGSGVRVGGWELTHAAARRWAAEHVEPRETAAAGGRRP